MSEATEMHDKVEEFNRIVKRTLKQHWRLFTVEGVLLALLGAASVIVPQVASIATTILIGWLLFVGGVFRLATTVGAKHAPGYWSSLLLSVLMGLLGALLALWPVQGVLTLTVVLIAYFFAHGVASMIFAFSIREETVRWVWILLSGIVDFALAALILSGWPGTAAWVLGLLVGINLMFTGIALIFAAVGAREA